MSEPEIDACSLDELPDELPDDYAPLNPKSECSICQAVTADVFGIIHTSRERPKKKHGDNFFRIVGLIAAVCEDLPMRHPIQPTQRDDVLEACQDFWDDNEDSFVKMVFNRSPEFALSLCSEALDVCEEDMSPSQLYAFDRRTARRTSCSSPRRRGAPVRSCRARRRSPAAKRTVYVPAPAGILVPFPSRKIRV